jgi:phosphatidylglycerol:prolipoprotein diacylglycerol transferase
MYPVLFRIGSFEITSFGAMVAIGALAGLWIFQRELRRSALPDQAADAAVAGLIGGLAGAKLLWVAEHFNEEPFTSLLLSRGGLSWFGGFTGGVGIGLAVMRYHRWRVMPILAAATPALAIGHAIGRLGCFLVGDDYGRPSTLPWAVAFPDGLPPTSTPVHPTQLYEAAALVPIAWMVIRWRAKGRSDRAVLGLYLVLTASLRFVIEIIRINERVALGLTVAQWVSLVLIAVGCGLLARPGQTPADAPTVHTAR